MKLLIRKEIFFTPIRQRTFLFFLYDVTLEKHFPTHISQQSYCNMITAISTNFCRHTSALRYGTLAPIHMSCSPRQWFPTCELYTSWRPQGYSKGCHEVIPTILIYHRTSMIVFLFQPALGCSSFCPLLLFFWLIKCDILYSSYYVYKEAGIMQSI